jgi:hypothetical protein
MSKSLLSLAVDAGIDFASNVNGRRGDPRPELRLFFSQVGLDWSQAVEAYDLGEERGLDFLVWLKTQLQRKHLSAYVWFEIGFFTIETVGVALRQDAPLDLVLVGYEHHLEEANVPMSERRKIGRLVQSLATTPVNGRGIVLKNIRELLRQSAQNIENADHKFREIVKRPSVVLGLVGAIATSVVAGFIVNVIPNPFAQSNANAKIEWDHRVNPKNAREYICIANEKDIGTWRNCQKDGTCSNVLATLELCERLYEAKIRKGQSLGTLPKN